MELTFDETKHQYYVDGDPVPSVTQIVAPLGADYDEPEDDARELTVEAAAERGITLHGYIAHRLGGGAPEEFELPDAYRGYADAIELFLAEHTITPFAVEQPLGCDFFAGTPDLTAELDGKYSILDWKFVSQISKSKVAAQLGGYAYLCEENGFTAEALFAVQFTRDGTYRLYPVDAAFAGDAYRACVCLYAFKTRAHPRGKIGG